MSYNLLKGKRGIIFGALNEMSIAWKVAEKAVEEGATITLSNTPMAVRMGESDRCTFLHSFFSYFPCNGHFIKGSENNTSFSL
jgi:enoyl-[acyl-carrier-protein] reductase (NADH)